LKLENSVEIIISRNNKLIDNKLSDIIKFACDNIENPACYEFLKYAFPKDQYPKQINNCTIMGADDNPIKIIKLTLQMLELMNNE